MTRREFIIVLGGAAAAWPLPVRGQQSPSFLRVGANGVLPRTTAIYVAFIERMAELGYEEGKNFSFEYVQAANVAGYEAAYHELASRNVDILLAGGSEIGHKFALAAAGTRPIVMVAIDYDPLAGGYLRSLARPGVNLTDISFQQMSYRKAFADRERGIPGGAGDRRVLGRNLRRTMACRGERCSETRLAACRRQVPRAAL